MSIDKDTVRYISNLSRIHIEDKELEGFTAQLDKILDYVKKLEKLDLKDEEPTSHVLKLQNVYRDDKVERSLPVEEVLSGAPLKENNLFKVKKIIEG